MKKQYIIPKKLSCPACSKRKWKQIEASKDGLLLLCTSCDTTSFHPLDVKKLKVKGKQSKPAKKPNPIKKPIKNAIDQKVLDAYLEQEKEEKPFVFPEDMKDKHRRFCVEYTIDSNKTQAAIRAGYEPNSAHVTGCRMLINAKVRETVNELLERAAKRALVTKTEITRWLLEIVGVSPADFQTMGADGVWTQDIGPDHPDKGALQSIESRTEYDSNGNTSTIVSKIKCYPRDQAIKQLRELYGFDAPKKQDLTSGGDKLGIIVIPAEQEPEMGQE